MINSIRSGFTGGYLMVNSDNYSSMPYIGSNPSNPLQGMMRINGNNCEVFDGGGWMTLAMANSDISLSADAIQILDWAKKKMAQEQEFEQLAETHECIRDLKEQAELAQHKLDMMVKLVSTKEKV